MLYFEPHSGIGTGDLLREKGIKEKLIKVNLVLVRMSPVMEVLTGFMIAGLIYYSGILILEGDLQINNFFSFLAAMMLAYQPVRSLATLNITLNQCLSASKRVIPIIDSKSKIVEKSNSKNLNVSNGNIIFKNVNFKYYEDAKEEVLNSVNLKFLIFVVLQLKLWLFFFLTILLQMRQAEP